ncbi:AAA family ATPase [Micropruina sp.]|uniref:AAA family ATPase n=1 Tax=Micropruina sp. TaxID=2737536 RepID=UPI002624F1FE|nr:AAA family ATPase [Micropruina sp.]
MSIQRGSVLVIAGPPAAGKTTIAARIAATAEVPTVHVPTDALHTWIKAGFVLPFLPEGVHQNAVIQNVMLNVARAYSEGGYDVILDGVLGPWAVDGLRDGAADAGLSLSYIIVRPSLPVLLARAQAREGRHLREIEPIVGLDRAFGAIDESVLTVLDTSDLSIDDSAHSVMKAWRDGSLQLTSGDGNREA